MPEKVSACLWFDGQGEEAARFYVSLLPDSEIISIFRPDPKGPPLIVAFTLCGAPYQALNGGPHFKFNEAASIVVVTKDQEETDCLWNALTANGGAESRCGWLKDKYGLSWQIVPEGLPRLLTDGDPAAADRAMQAMLKMNKIAIATIEAAFRGK